MTAHIWTCITPSCLIVALFSGTNFTEQGKNLGIETALEASNGSGTQEPHSVVPSRSNLHCNGETHEGFGVLLNSTDTRTVFTLSAHVQYYRLYVNTGYAHW